MLRAPAASCCATYVTAVSADGKNWPTPASSTVHGHGHGATRLVVRSSTPDSTSPIARSRPLGRSNFRSARSAASTQSAGGGSAADAAVIAPDVAAIAQTAAAARLRYRPNLAMRWLAERRTHTGTELTRGKRSHSAVTERPCCVPFWFTAGL